MDRVKVAIIGCGVMSHYGHAPGYLSYRDKAELVAVCDTVKATAEQSARDWGARKVYTDYKELLKDDEIDAVDIVLPHYLHAPVTIAAAEAGKHVTVQKPMAMNDREADEMIAATRKAGVKFMISESEVFYPPYAKAKELIESGEIGEPSVLRLANKYGIKRPQTTERTPQQRKPQEGYIPWRGDPKLFGGGSLFGGGYHKFAHIIFLLGEVEEVRAWIDNMERQAPHVMMWKYKAKGKYGVMETTMSPEMHIDAEDRAPIGETVEVTGSSGILWVTRCEGRVRKEPPVIVYKGEGHGQTISYDNIETNYKEGFKRMTHHFIDCILEDKQPIFNGEIGKKTLQLCLSVYKSAQMNGEAVRPDDIIDWKWLWEQRQEKPI